jgi:hypothetical protein
MARRSYSLGITPASLSLLALMIIMNFMVDSPVGGECGAG